MERFACKTMIVSGDGALQALSEGEISRLAVVTEHFQVQSGLVQHILNQAKCQEAVVIEDVNPEPTIRQAVKGAETLRAFRPDGVIALGGGNVMDCAKAMRCFAKEKCSLTVIPMAVGTGAEVTDWVTLSHERTRHTLRDETMRPDRAILDSELLGRSSRGALCEGGFSLLASALESYTARKAGLLADIHAREAFAVTWAALPAAFAGNEAARKRVQMASIMAGIAQDQSGAGLCSALCGSLESVFHLPRGKLAGILLPAIVGCNAHAVGRRYAELARASGMGGSSDAMGLRNLKTGLARLRRELGLPGTLAQAGVDPRQVWGNAKRIVQMTLENPECRNNPVTVDDFLVRRILEEMTGRI